MSDKSRVYDIMEYIEDLKDPKSPVCLVEDRFGSPLLMYRFEPSSNSDAKKEFSAHLVGKYGNTFETVGNSLISKMDKSKLKLDYIHVDSEFRGNGLGSILYDYDEIITRGVSSKCIIGLFSPYDLSNQVEDGYTLNNRALGLYKKKGFELISLYDYLKDKKAYPYASKHDFASCLNPRKVQIIYKPVIKRSLQAYGLRMTKEGVLLPKKLAHKYEDCLHIM